MRHSQFTVLILSAIPPHTEWRACRKRREKNAFKSNEINIVLWGHEGIRWWWCEEDTLQMPC